MNKRLIQTICWAVLSVYATLEYAVLSKNFSGEPIMIMAGIGLIVAIFGSTPRCPESGKNE